MQIYIWIAIVVFFTGFIKGLSGFGTMLVAIPLLMFFIDIKMILPLIFLLGSSGTVFLLTQLFKHLDWREIYPILVGFVPGLLAGVFLLKTLDPDVLRFILGIVLISYSIYSLFFEMSRWNIKNIRKVWAYLFGFFSGGLGGSIGASGPPVLIYTSSQQWNKDKIKVSVQGFFLISNLMTIISHAYVGLITTTVLKFFIFSLPTFVFGVYVGSRFYGTIKDETYKQIISTMLGVLGFLSIYKAL
ncbi:MAG: sulfite exporter TauE/SafE family protein [Deltaproteobacteria bacterium]|nr:sulfite exporter TauE/SafE family protein [Deltaproteobacteria bacterium]MBW2323251.1 sulfite exporter TauE/SafE family protein [Deltaproteobacteria bacterium]